MIEFNINHWVRVKLTEHGRQHHRRKNEALLWEHGADYQPPEEDAEGWSKWQLWDLMCEFGDGILMAGPLMFETTIQLIVEENR
jgi:hypothetical protein